MHLAIDAVGAKHSGGAVILLEVVSAALRSEDIGRITLFCSPARVRNFALPDCGKLAIIEQPAAESRGAARVHWLSHGLARAVARVSADVLLCMSGICATDPGVPFFLYAQQSLPFSPEAMARMTPKQRIRLNTVRALMCLSARNASAVVAQTPSAARAISSIMPPDQKSILVCPPALRFASLAPAAIRHQTSAHLLGKPRVLYVGSDSPHKNLGALLDSWSLVRQHAPSATLWLTLSKGIGRAATDDINCVGYLGSAELRELYLSASALVFPSLVETVGLPMLEAMALGLPVVAANRPYAHDICGRAALYFDPSNPRDLAEKLSHLLNSPIDQTKMARRGIEIAARYGQKDGTLSLLRHLVRAGRASPS